VTLELVVPPLTGRRLFVLGCSQTKLSTAGSVPAITRYDGPLFRVLRAFLRDHLWPAGISNYDQRLTPERAQKIRPEVTEGLSRLLAEHGTAELFMGRGYLEAIDLHGLGGRARKLTFIEGGIGQKLRQLRERLSTLGALRESPVSPLLRKGRPLYFLPDWDDFLDVDYDFANDRLSAPKRQNRREAHSLKLMRPHRLCDGVLVSLAQHAGTKGLLRRVASATPDSLAPRPVREHFGLAADQWAFADCGAFSYSSADEPTISVEQAVAVYDLYGFDLGASVDHIPLKEIRRSGKREELGEKERLRRVELTRNNAEVFLRLACRKQARFLPVGIIQGLGVEDYGNQIGNYVDMGYRYLALGGLVPRPDAEVLAIVECAEAQLRRLKSRPWLHLMGIFRPRLQTHFLRLGVDSFDSATYFRKAWLRSDQNYLGVDGKWYAAIRIPPSYDRSTAKRLLQSGNSEEVISQLEQRALSAIRSFDRGRLALSACLEAIMEYDRLLGRSNSEESRLKKAYRRTLAETPWRLCSCPVCSELGVEALIFRGLNRNKRRGAHNTWRLFCKLHPYSEDRNY
jgi:queuine tRNA-ribosyltransferase-like protein